MTEAKWLDEPDEHDFDAARSYLSLLMSVRDAIVITGRVKNGDAAHFKAKDILRASGLPLLDKDNKHVAADLKKMENGEKLSPILLARGSLGQMPLLIADGYHRVCASYWLDENTLIPCMIG